MWETKNVTQKRKEKKKKECHRQKKSSEFRKIPQTIVNLKKKNLPHECSLDRQFLWVLLLVVGELHTCASSLPQENQKSILSPHKMVLIYMLKSKKK